LGVWVLLISGAIAYGRGAGGARPIPRYMDFLSLGFFANALALTALLDGTSKGTSRWRVAACALAAWLVVGAVGLNYLVLGTLPDLSRWRQNWIAQASNIERYLATGDRRAFVSRPSNELAYPDAAALADVLQNPFVRRILPMQRRAPDTHIQEPGASSRAFPPLLSSGWAGSLAESMIAISPELLFASLALIALKATRWT